MLHYIFYIKKVGNFSNRRIQILQREKDWLQAQMGQELGGELPPRLREDESLTR